MRLPAFLSNMATSLGLFPVESGTANRPAELRADGREQTRYTANTDKMPQFKDRRIAALFADNRLIQKADVDFICTRFDRSLDDRRSERAQYVIALHQIATRQKDPLLHAYAGERLTSIAERVFGAVFVVTELRDILRTEVKAEPRNFTSMNELILLIDMFLKSPTDALVLLKDPEPMIRTLYLELTLRTEEDPPAKLLTIIWQHQQFLIEADINSLDRRIVMDALTNLLLFASYGMQNAHDKLIAISQNDRRPWCRQHAGNLLQQIGTK